MPRLELQNLLRGSSNAVLHRARAGHARAVGAAVDGAVCLHAVADDPDAAVLASRGERVDRTLEAVEYVRLVVGQRYPERLVVLIATHFALRHPQTPFSRSSRPRFGSNIDARCCGIETFPSSAVRTRPCIN